MITIYGLLDPSTQRLRYVGKTSKNLPLRLREHICAASSGNRKYVCHRTNWIRSLLNVGLEPDIFEIETTSEESWRSDERFWISYFRFVGADLTNQTDGGDTGPSWKGKKLSDEHRRKISESHKGKKRPDMSERSRGNKYNLGRKHGLEARKNMSMAQKLVKHKPASLRTRLKMSGSQVGNTNCLGNKLTDEHKRKIGEANLGRRLTEETRRKISESLRGHIAWNKGKHYRKLGKLPKEAI